MFWGKNTLNQIIIKSTFRDLGQSAEIIILEGVTVSMTGSQLLELFAGSQHANAKRKYEIFIAINASHGEAIPSGEKKKIK